MLTHLLGRCRSVRAAPPLERPAAAVLHQQDRLRSARRGPCRRQHGATLGRLVGAPQIDLDGGPLAGLAVDPEGAAALADDAIDRREAEAGPPALLLGGEERLEHVL